MVPSNGIWKLHCETWPNAFWDLFDGQILSHKIGIRLCLFEDVNGLLYSVFAKNQCWWTSDHNLNICTARSLQHPVWSWPDACLWGQGLQQQELELCSSRRSVARSWWMIQGDNVVTFQHVSLVMAITRVRATTYCATMALSHKMNFVVMSASISRSTKDFATNLTFGAPSTVWN